MKVHTHAEWDPLREVILGSATGAQIPTIKDISLRAIDYGTVDDETFERATAGPYPKRIVDEANEDLEMFAEALLRLGIMIHRPAPGDFTEILRTDHWAVDGYHACCPRDVILTIGTRAIEAPMALRHRQNEARLYRHILHTSSAPRPKLLDSLYALDAASGIHLRDDEPVFDASNCLKLGRDILYLISNTGNRAGATWLQQELGSDYRVHALRSHGARRHIDAALVPLRPGLLLINPERITSDDLPPFLRSWEQIRVPDVDPFPYDPTLGPASRWIALGCLSLRPDLLAIEAGQTSLIRTLEKRGFDCLPVRLRHMRTLTGGPRCVSLDVVRAGTLQDYS